MYILRIEHPIVDFDEWKKMFDSDPLGRQKSGVRRHRVLRPIDIPNTILIDLEFQTVKDAEALAVNLRELWKRIGGNAVSAGKTQVVEIVEAKEY